MLKSIKRAFAPIEATEKECVFSQIEVLERNGNPTLTIQITSDEATIAVLHSTLMKAAYSVLVGGTTHG